MASVSTPIQIALQDLEDVRRMAATLTRVQELLSGSGDPSTRIDLALNEMSRFASGQWPHGKEEEA